VGIAADRRAVLGHSLYPRKLLRSGDEHQQPGELWRDQHGIDPGQSDAGQPLDRIGLARFVLTSDLSKETGERAMDPLLVSLLMNEKGRVASQADLA
jgi:hypothetical protein